MTAAADIGARLQELRAAFDRAFERAPDELRREGARYVLLRSSKDRFAVSVAELAAIERLGEIMPLPAPDPRLLGVASVTGRLTAVFSLAKLLGLAGLGPPRWLALLRDDRSVALAFEVLDGLCEAKSEDLHRVEPGTGHGFVQEALALESGKVPILNLNPIYAVVREQSSRRGE